MSDSNVDSKRRAIRRAEPKEGIGTAVQPSLDATSTAKETVEAGKAAPRPPEPEVQSRQLVPTVVGTALADYENRVIIQELADRLLAFHPAAKEVGRSGMFMAAQLAVMLGASPLPSVNEIHIWRDERGNVAVVPGINYWTRRAEQKGGVWWDIEARPMMAEERILYEIPDGVSAAICRGVPARIVHYWVSGQKMPLATVMASFGSVGIGTVAPGEYAKKGRPPMWTAMKRARKDALSQLFPFIPGESLGKGGVGMVIDNDTGSYVPDFRNPAWATLAPGLHEHLPSGQVAVMSLDELNGDLFGNEYDNTYTNPLLGDE